MPLNLLEVKGNLSPPETESSAVDVEAENSYGSINREDEESGGTHRNSIAPHPNASLMLYLRSIIKLPKSIRVLCLTNLFSWMAHVCYSLYFTDFVGEAVFGGNPTVSIWSNGIGVRGTRVRFSVVVCVPTF